MASDQCVAETNSGARCKRVARQVRRRNWEEPFLFFFHRKVEKFDRLCNQHAASSKVGVIVGEIVD